MLSNMQKQGVSEQAIRTLSERVGQCNAALTLRTKPLRNMETEKYNGLLRALKPFWNSFSWAIRARIADAYSDNLQKELAELECSGKVLEKRVAVMERSLIYTVSIYIKYTYIYTILYIYI